MDCLLMDLAAGWESWRRRDPGAIDPLKDGDQGAGLASAGNSIEAYGVNRFQCMQTSW